MCKHVAALLYHTAHEVAEGRNQACTSVPQKWHKPTSLETSAFVSNIKTPKASSRVAVKEASRSRRDDFDPRPMNIRRPGTLADFDLDRLASISKGKAAVLLYSQQFRSNVADASTAPDIRSVACTVTVETTEPVPSVHAAFDKNHPSSPADLIEQLRFSTVSRHTLEQSTRGQSANVEWVKQRTGRMTASVMHSVLSHVSDDEVHGSVASVVEGIMGYADPFTSKATSHGKMREGEVHKRYAKEMVKTHHSLKVTQSGLWLLEEYPLIGASPDGVVTCSCCPDRLLEIKCPYKHRFSTVAQYAQQGTSQTAARHDTVVIWLDGTVVVNICHPYYTQMQTQMLCTGLGSCDLAIGTMSSQDNFRVFNVKKDEQFCLRIKEKAAVFFEKVLFPELQNKSYLKHKQSKNEKKKHLTSEM